MSIIHSHILSVKSNMASIKRFTKNVKSYLLRRRPLRDTISALSSLML